VVASDADSPKLRRQVSMPWPKLEEFREQLPVFLAGEEKDQS